MANKTTAPRTKGKRRRHALALREPLTPERVQRIVLNETPTVPPDPVDPDAQLRQFGIINGETAAAHRAGIQADLNSFGWHIKQAEISSSPTTTVAECRDSVLSHAF